jgi:hypothetical protein
VSQFPELIAFDLDGTLLRSDGSLSPRVRQAVREIKSQGCVIALSTGRPWRAVAEIVDRLGVVDYCVCLNGASLHRPDGQPLKLNAMTEEQTRESAQLARRLIPGVSLAADMADGRHIWDEGFTHDFPADFSMTPIRVPNAVTALDGPVLTWLLDCKDIAPMRAIQAMSAQMPEGTEVRPSGLETPEIVASGVSKGTGLDEVATMNAIDASNAWVFGDGLNDLEMFLWAGYSVAMGNAHPKLLSMAAYVAPSHDEDGVAVVLEDLLTS